MHHLFSQHVLHDAIISVGKVEEQLHVIATIDASNQLIVAYKNIDHMFKPNKNFQRRKKLSIHWDTAGLDLIGSNQTPPSQTLKEGRNTTLCIYKWGGDFKITLGGA